MSYTPPPGSSVTLEFGGDAYSSPPGSSVTLEFDAAAGTIIYPQGMFDYGYGMPYVILGQRWVTPDGIESAEAIGDAGVEYEKVRPTGIESEESHGVATVWLGQQWAYPESIVVEMRAGHVLRRDDWYAAPVPPLILEFGSAPYTVPPADSVTIEFMPDGSTRIYAHAIAQAGIGSARVANLWQYTFPTAIGQDAFGTAFIENSIRYVEPSAFDASLIGSAELTNDAVVLNADGIDPGALGFAGDGEGFVDFSLRALETTSITPTAFGTQRVENVNRGIDLAGNGLLATRIGTQFIAYKERFVSPPYIFANAQGIATIGFTRELLPSGFDSQQFGVQYVHDNTQRADSAGAIVDWSVEIPMVTRSPRVIFASGFDLSEIAPSERWGRPDVVNFTQILPRVAIDPDPENGGVFGEPNNTLVENRNRTIVHYGHQDSKVSALATLNNTGRAVELPGLDATAWGDALIAPAIRSYSLEGIPPEWFTPYHAVHNAAFQALPEGIAPGDVGVPAWANPPQALTFVGHIDSQEHGTAFVDFAVRYVAPPLGPEAIVGSPDVQLAMRYLEPTGLEATRWGATYVYEHFNIAAAQSILPPVAPLEHYVRNVTPQVYPYGYELTEWGRPTVRWNPWPIAPEGFVAGEYGRLWIHDRRQTAAPNGIGAGQMGMFAQVRNDSPDPPSTRSIVASGPLGSSYGTPSLRKTEIEAGGAVFTLFGEHEVRLIGAIVPSLEMPSPQVPTHVVRGPRPIAVTGMAPPDDDPRATVHDLSPRTIWATFDATEQAKRNHPGEWKLMDDALDTFEPRGMRPFFGTPALTLQHRRIVAAPATGALAPQEFPEPSIESTIRTVRPVGSLMQRFGIASLPGLQILDMDGAGFLSGDEGDHLVENFDKDVRPAGLAAPALADQDIQLFNRELPAPSLGAGATGTPRVHPPEPVIPGMGIQTLWGSHLVAFRIRPVYPSSIDAFGMGEEVGEFGDRMRVTKRFPLRPSSIAPGAVGAHRVSDASQRVQHVTLPPPGRPPAPAIEINTKIALGGLGQWYGDYGAAVITHADNLEFVCGHAARAIPIAGWGSQAFGVAELQEVASLVRRLYPTAIDPYDVGDARVAWSVTPAGLDEWASGDHALTYVVTADAVDDGAIGTVTITVPLGVGSIGDGLELGLPLITMRVSPSGWIDDDLSALYALEDYAAGDYFANDSGVWVKRG